jgi:hypothetical protein
MKLAGADDPEAAHEAAKKKNAAEQQASRAKSVQPKDNADVSVNLSEYDPVEDILDRIGRLSETDCARLIARLKDSYQWQ